MFTSLLFSRALALDFELYEEVEPYTGLRPVVILGALADQVMTALLENLPNMFYQCEKSKCVRVTIHQ